MVRHYIKPFKTLSNPVGPARAPRGDAERFAATKEETAAEITELETKIGELSDSVRAGSPY